MEYLDFLKYGAMGLSLALAYLSYLLLSREQKKSKIRTEMLKSIKSFKNFALLLSLFFGMIEIIPQLSPILSSKIIPIISGNLEGNINNILDKHHITYDEITIARKLEKIDSKLSNSSEQVDTSAICKTYITDLINCKKELGDSGQGFYHEAFLLHKLIYMQKNHFANLSFEQSEKTEIFATLKEIFISLGYQDNILSSDNDIKYKWENLKKNWKSENFDHIYASDIAQVIVKYQAILKERI